VLTGQSLPVEETPDVAAAAAGVSERTHVLFMCTSGRSGTGTMLVVGTGMNSAYGEIAHGLSLRRLETEFERGVRRFGYLLTRNILTSTATRAGTEPACGPGTDTEPPGDPGFPYTDCQPRPTSPRFSELILHVEGPRSGGLPVIRA
jgi:hypothetical protein